MGSGRLAEHTEPEVGIYCHSVGTSVHDIGARTSENNPHAFGDRVAYPLAATTGTRSSCTSARRSREWENKIVKCTIEETALMTEDGPTIPGASAGGLLLIPS